jgi:putative ribosome biogenesis GTPase RsgA
MTAAALDGRIAPERLESYRLLLQEVTDEKKDWE